MVLGRAPFEHQRGNSKSPPSAVVVAEAAAANVVSCVEAAIENSGGVRERAPECVCVVKFESIDLGKDKLSGCELRRNHCYYYGAQSEERRGSKPEIFRIGGNSTAFRICETVAGETMQEVHSGRAANSKEFGPAYGPNVAISGWCQVKLFIGTVLF